MIKASTIIAQLQTELPNQTDLFSNADIAISSLSLSGSTVIANTVTPHGLSNGNYITILNAKTPIEISSITSTPKPGIDAIGAIVTVTTITDHDFTEGFDFEAEIVGAEQDAYNGEHLILTVPNRRKFTYEILTQPTTPATGSLKLLNTIAFGYNGRKEITVTNANIFTYQVDDTFGTPAQGTPVLRSGIRVSGAISWERAREAYTKQAPNKLWAFVILGDNSTSKDRNVTTDAISTLARGDAYRQRVISPFSVFVYAPCTNETSGRAVRDQMEDVRIALYKSILRAELPSVLVEARTYVVTASGDRFVWYADGAYYIHEFMFEIVCDITIGDTVAPTENRAFRDFSLIFRDPDLEDGNDILLETLDISLDDEPLS